MSKMKAIYEYCVTQDLQGLTEYLRELGWRQPGYCAEQFLKGATPKLEKEKNNDRLDSKARG